MQRRQRGLMAGYAACLVLLAVAYYLLPGLRAAAWSLLGLTGVAGLVTGVLLHRPARRAPWLLLAAGSLCALAGQVLAPASAGPAGRPPPFPSPADACYLARYPLYLAGLALLIRARAAGRDRRSLLDTLTVTAGAATAAWLYLVLPDIRAAGLPGLGRAAAIGYSLGELLLLALLAASLPAPAVLLTEALDRQLPAAAMIAVCSAVLYLLVISRLADATGSLRVALDRTYVLRAAAGRPPNELTASTHGSRTRLDTVIARGECSH